MRPTLTTAEVSHIGNYISEEVKRQQDGPIDVGHMLDAWMYAIIQKESGKPLTVEMIEQFGSFVKPSVNVWGFRGYVIFIGGVPGQVNPKDVKDRMVRLVDLINKGLMQPSEAYYEFEIIHPFGDGNGRVGKIIYNWLNDTLRQPTFPPDFFGGIGNP